MFGFSFESDCGFFSVYFFFLEVYIFCRKQDKRVQINDHKWKFCHTLGLKDYFDIPDEYIECNSDFSSGPTIFKHMFCPICRYSLDTYKEYIKEIYIPNIEIRTKVQEYKKSLPQRFDSIFVRWGDKLYVESKYIEPRVYIEMLVNISDTPDIFIHSDDHDEVVKFKTYISSAYPEKIVHSITDESDSGGALVMEMLRYYGKLTKKSVDTMDRDERKQHTEKMLCAIEIMRSSGVVVLDYQSNVSRFMKIYFDCQVVSVNKEDSNINTTKGVENPSYGF